MITCINPFSKMVQMVLLQESDAHTMAEKFLSMVLSQHGLPEYIISYCNPHFCGHFWNELLSLLDIPLTFTMASHPHTDGMAEVTSCTMEQLLQIHV